MLLTLSASPNYSNYIYIYILACLTSPHYREECPDHVAIYGGFFFLFSFFKSRCSNDEKKKLVDYFRCRTSFSSSTSQRSRRNMAGNVQMHFACNSRSNLKARIQYSGHSQLSRSHRFLFVVTKCCLWKNLFFFFLIGDHNLLFIYIYIWILLQMPAFYMNMELGVIFSLTLS